MTDTVRIPIALASRKGVSGLAAMSQDNRLLLTSHGRGVAVVDSAERLDGEIQRMREAAWAVLEAAASLVAQRTETYDFETVCEKVGVDPERVRQRVAARRQEADAR